MSDLKLLHKVLKAQKLIDIDALEDADLDEMQDARDEPEFEDFWVAAQEALADSELSEPDQGLVDSIREIAFKTVYRATDQSDLAGYVADDFELIGKALATRADAPFPRFLLTEYLAGRIPHEPVEEPIVAPKWEKLLEELKNQLE